MTLLLMTLLVLAAVTAANLFAYARVLRIEDEADVSLAPAVDYAALQARWHRERQASDWASLQAQVRRWQAPAAQDASAERADEAARALNDAVFRFALPGERPSFHVAAQARPHPASDANSARRCFRSARTNEGIRL